MRRESDWRARNNPLHIDLFERSSQSLSSSASSSTLDMARNDEGNVRRHLSDYARPVFMLVLGAILQLVSDYASSGCDLLVDGANEQNELARGRDT